MGRLPLPEYLLPPGGGGFSQRFLPNMVNIKANIKAYKKSPEGNPRKDWEFPGSVSWQGQVGYPGGGVQRLRPPPRGPKYDGALGGGDFYRGGRRGQVLG